MSNLKKMFLAAVLAALFCGVSVQAANIDTDRICSLTVYDLYGTEEDPVSNVEFSVSKVASVSYQGVYSLEPAYQSCGVTDDDINSTNHASDLSDMIEKLKTVSGQGAKEAATDEKGKVVFENLTVGLYLITAEDMETDSGIYSSSASLAAIPGLENEDWLYDVTIFVKTEKTALETPGETIPTEVAEMTEEIVKTEMTDITGMTEETVATEGSKETEEPVMTEKTEITEKTEEPAMTGETIVTEKETEELETEEGTEISEEYTEETDSLIFPSAYSLNSETEDESASNTEDGKTETSADSVQTGDNTPIGQMTILFTAALLVFSKSWKCHKQYRR